MADDFWAALEGPTNVPGGKVQFIDPPEPMDGPEQILAQMEADAGVTLQGADRIRAINQIRNGDFDIAFPTATNTDFWTGLDTPPETTAAPVVPEEGGYWSDRMDDLRIASESLGTGLDAAQGTLQEAYGQLNRFVAEEGSTGRGGKPIVSLQEGFTEDSKAALAAGAANKKIVADYRAEKGLGEGFDGGLEGILLDVAANPDMALTSGAALIPVVGTAVASVLAPIPAGRVFLNDYYSQIDAGVPKDEARQHALAQAAIELGAELTPGGKFLKGGKELTSTGWKVVKATAEEGVQESVTEAVQGGLDTLITEGGYGSEALQESAERSDFDTSAEFGERIAYAGAVGSVAAGGMTVVPAHLATAAEQGHKAALVQSAMFDNLDKAKDRANKVELDKRREDDLLNENLKFEQERIRQEQAKQDAFTKAEQERVAREAAEARQTELEQEAGLRTVERDNAQRGQENLVRYGPGNLERTPVNPAAPITPEQVQAEREQEAAAEAARVERVERGGLTEQLRKRQEKAAKKAADTQKKTEAQAKAAETKKRNTIMDELIAANPGVAPVDLVDKVRERMAAPAPSTASAATTPAVAPVTAPVAPKAAQKKASVPDNKLTDANIADLTGKLGLDMMGSTKGDESTQEEFTAKAKDTIKALVGRVTKTSADVQNLLLQGKLIIAPNAAYLGRKANGTEQAQYDVVDGKMYMYLDNIESKDVGAVIMAALHESTHAGQFNNRDGRPSVLKQMMGTKENEVTKAILAAAKKGNKLAQRAVTQAQEAHPNKTIQDLELVPYFVGEAAKAREGYGQMGGIVRDIVAAGKNFIRDGMGIDLAVSLNDIDAAAQKTAGEAAKTELKGDRRGVAGVRDLDMIGGVDGAGFDQAPFSYRGAVDGKLRYEFSDENASLNSDTLYQMVEDSESEEGKDVKVPLGELLDHPELYKNYPDAARLPIALTSMDSLGSYHGKRAGIKLEKGMYLTPEDLLDTLLHEVQHYIQDVEGFVAGANSRMLVSKAAMREMDDATKAEGQAVDQFDLGVAVKALPPHARETWDKIEERHESFNGIGNRRALVRTFLARNYSGATGNREIMRQAERYDKATKRVAEARAQLAEAEKVALRTYLRDYGETEARNTSYRKGFSEAQRKAQPPESTMKDAESNVPVEDTVDTSKLRSGQVPASERSLSMAASVKAAPVSKLPVSRKIPAWVSGLFSATGATGEAAREIFESAAASPSLDRMIAESTMREYKRAVEKMALERGMTAEGLNKKIIADLEAVDKKSDSYEANLAAFKSVADKYGAAGQALVKFRNQADNLTIEIIKARVDQGTPLTPAEKEVYQTMANNLGRYAHRQFAIHMGKQGKKYAEQVLDHYNQYKKGGKTSPIMKENYLRVQRVVNKLIDERLTIPEDADLAKLDADHVRSLFSEWGGVPDIKAYTLDQMRDGLAGIRDTVNGNKDELTATAESIVKQILGLTEAESLVAKYYIGGKIDQTILKERTQLSPEMRDLMGEITDPAMRLFTTVAKQAEFVARTRMLMELRDNADPAHIQPPGSQGRPEVKDMTRLSGDAYGPLNGHFVSKNMANVLSDHVQQLATFEQAVAMAAARPDVLGQLAATSLVKGWGKLAGVTKMLQIIGKPVNFLLNFMGGPLIMLTNGNINPRHFGKALITATDIIRYARNPGHNTPEARRVTAAGITDSAFIGEINAELYDELTRTLKAMQGKTPSAVWAAISKLGVGTKELYAMMDVTYKIANFYQQADAVLPAYYKAAGETRTQEQLDREAADITNATNITYKRAAPLIRSLEKYGVTNFGTFIYEVFRSQVNNLRQGAREIDRGRNAPTDEARNVMLMQGTRRIAGQLTALSAVLMASRALAASVFGDDDEKEQKIRDVLPDYERNKDFMVVGKDKDGIPVLMDVARVDPAGPFTDVIRAGMNGEKSGDEILSSIYQFYIAPRIVGRLASAVGTTTGINKKAPAEPTVQQLMPDAYAKFLSGANAADVSNRSAKAWTNVAETFLPGVVTGWRESNARPVVEDKASALALALTYGGLTMYKLDGSKKLVSTAYDYNDQVKTNRKTIEEMFKDNPNITADEVQSRLLKLKASEQEAFEKMRSVYEGMQALDVPTRQMNVSLKETKIGGDVIKDLGKGEFEFRSVSKDSIKSYKDKELKGLKGQELTDARAKWKNIWAMLEAGKQEVENEE